MKEVLESLRLIVDHQLNCPNITAVATEYANGDDDVRDNLIRESCKKVRPVIDKFESMFEEEGGKLKRMMKIYSGLAYVAPFKFSNSSNEARIAAVNNIMLIEPFHNHEFQSLRDELLKEIPLYTVESNGVDSEMNPFEWWKDRKSKLPNWFRVFGEAVILQPSSGCSERIFSILRRMFNDSQQGALEDYKETSIMLRFNEMYRNK